MLPARALQPVMADDTLAPITDDNPPQLLEARTAIAAAHLGHGHGHGRVHGNPVTRLSRSANRILGAVVALLLLGTVAGMVILWPSGDLPREQQVTQAFEGVDIVRGSVVSVTDEVCPGMSEDRLPSGEIPLVARCATAVVQVEDDAGAADAGRHDVIVPYEVFRSGISADDAVDIARYDVRGSDEPVWAWVDFARELPLGLLAGAFALLVVTVGRLRGLAALGGLLMGYVTVFAFMLPALQRQEDGPPQRPTSSV